MHVIIVMSTMMSLTMLLVMSMWCPQWDQHF